MDHQKDHAFASQEDYARWLREEYVPIAGGWQY